MISKLLNSLERGFRVMRSNNRLLFVGALIFVFPLLFIYITQGFFETAYTNIQTSEKRRVGMLHDSLSVLVRQSNIPEETLKNVLENQATQNPDITEIRIVEKTNQGLLVLHSLDNEATGDIETKTELYDKAALATNNTSFIFEFILDQNRMWQVVNVSTPEGKQYFILTEHSFSTIDSVMASRRQQSYLGLSAIFLFLLGLAYWFYRQMDWQKKHDQLQNQLEERDLFTNMIAHEFRTPLTAINGYSSFLAESQTPTQDEKRYIQNIQLSTARLLALVNDFLEVARIQSGKLSLEMKNQDIQPILEGVVDTLRQTAIEKNINLAYIPLLSPVLHATDAKRLHQVIQNLVSNSLKYTEKGSVEIVCEQTSVATSIRIKDTGMGISAEDQQKLFAPFSRVGGVEKTNITGTGLGMWITKQLVEALGGTISVESIKNVGTHVVITFKR